MDFHFRKLNFNGSDFHLSNRSQFFKINSQNIDRRFLAKALKSNDDMPYKSTNAIN